MPRPHSAALLLCSIALGLATRRFGDALPDGVSRYGGDVLWTVALFWVLALIWPRARPLTLGLAAFAISVMVEVSQLFHARWIDAIRESTIGALVLGQGFLWSDLVCYAAGAIVATAAALLVSRRYDSTPAR